MIELICMGCDKPFPRALKQHNANLRRGRAIVACSNSCVNRARFKNHSNLISSECLECAAGFSRKRSTNDKMMFCSKSCAASYNGKLRAKIKPPKVCRVCKKTVSSTRRQICEECKSEQRYSRRPDWNTITLQSLKDKYSTSQYHAKIRGMSRSEYKRSGKPMSCLIDGYSLHVDVCHITDVKDFPMNATISEVNHIDNLVALCKRCHWEFDNGYLEI